MELAGGFQVGIEDGTMLPEIIQAHPTIVANDLTGNFGKFQIREVIVSM